MSWKIKFERPISSSEIKPEVGMYVEAIHPIDKQRELIGNKGIIFSIAYSIIKIAWEDELLCGYEQYGHENTWNGSIREWNKGHYRILRK